MSATQQVSEIITSTELCFAFQPYVDAVLRTVVGHEALVRGAHGESADAVWQRVPEAERLAFDLRCRATALREAKRLGLDQTGQMLNLNVLANAIGVHGEHLLETLDVAVQLGFPCASLVIEITEVEYLENPAGLREVLRDLRGIGFRTAIDDLGAGWSNMLMLAEMQPDLVKIDRTLIEGIDANPRQRVIVRSIKRACDDLGCSIVAEGIEAEAESQTLIDLGIHLQQGFLFSRPCLNSLDLTASFPTLRVSGK